MPRTSRAPVTTRELAVMQRIDEARRDIGMSQEALASAVGVSQGQVSKILAGLRPASLSETLKMLEAVGLTLSDVADELGI